MENQNLDVLTPITIGNLTLKNKIVRSATNDYSGNTDGSVSNIQLEGYDELAKNNIGMIITGNFYIEPEGMLDKTQNSLYENYNLESIKKLTETVQRYNCKMIAQISHAGSKSKVNMGSNPMYNSPSCLTEQKIECLIKEFANAALRAKQAGFDGVQLHCGHGYLLSSFIDPNVNDRKDGYGGNISNRFLFAEKVLEAIKRECGEDYPILIKLNSNTKSKSAMNEQYEYINDVIYIAQKCEKLGVCAIELSGCDFVSYKQEQYNYYIEAALAIKQKVSIPIILVGGIRSLEDMEQVLKSGIDMVAVSRPLISEPNLITKLIKVWRRSSQLNEKSRCISCNRCFTLYSESNKRCVFHKI